MRRLLGWESRFVVINVGRNRQNKQQPKLLNAFAILKKMGFREMLCYFHCLPVENTFYHMGFKEIHKTRVTCYDHAIDDPPLYLLFLAKTFE